jgi:hypothetical protein
MKRLEGQRRTRPVTAIIALVAALFNLIEIMNIDLLGDPFYEFMT